MMKHYSCVSNSALMSLIFCYVMYSSFFSFFFFNDTATTEIYTLSLHDALPISEDIERSRNRRDSGGSEHHAGGSDVCGFLWKEGRNHHGDCTRGVAYGRGGRAGICHLG